MIKNRLILTLFIILTSFIYGLPNIILTQKLGSNYDVFPVSGSSPIARDEAFAYAPETNFILRGNFYLKEIYVKEYEQFPTPFLGETAPSLVFALLSKFTGNIEKAFIAGDFIFPPIIFVILYFITKIYINNNFFAIAVAFLTVIARDFIAVIPYPHETFQYLNVEEGQNYLLYFSRAFHPQLTFIFFCLAFLAVIKLFQFPNKNLLTIITGVLIGILFYSYVFYWTYFLFFIGLITVYLLWSKQNILFGKLFIATLIGLVLGSPYFYNMFQFYKLDIAADFISKTSLHNLPLPITLVRYLLIALGFFLVNRQKDHKRYPFFILLIAGILIAPVSKLVIGQDLETFHYLRRALMPFAAVAFFITFYLLIKKNTTLTIIIAAVIFMSALYIGLKTQIIASQRIYTAHIQDHQRQSVFEWLKKNTPKDSIVGSIDTTFNSLIPIFTENRIFFPPTDRTITPTLEGVQRYSIISNLLGINTVWQKSNLDNIVSYLFVYQSYDEQNRLDLYSPQRINAERQIEKFSKDENWKEYLGNFKLDYVVVTPSELSFINPRLDFLKPAASLDEYLIFKFKK